MYNHLKESEGNTHSTTRLLPTESYTQKSFPLASLSWESVQHIRQNQIIRKQKEKYLAHWKESTKKQSKLACYLSLNRDYTVAEYLTTVTGPKRRKSLTRYRLIEHSMAIEKGRHRQTWLPREDRLCSHCTHNQLETELHFLTSCQSYKDIRIHTSHGLRRQARTSKTLQMLTNCHTCWEKYNNVRTQQQDSSPVVMREGPQSHHRLIPLDSLLTQ